MILHKTGSAGACKPPLLKPLGQVSDGHALSAAAKAVLFSRART